MAEELDLPNREKCSALEAELERSREDYFQLRRTVEKLKIEKDQLHAEHEQNMLEAAEKHRVIENELKIRISALQVALEDTTEVEELHNLQRELNASRLREKNLIQELAEVRTAKEIMRVAKERAAQDTRDKVGEVQCELQRRDAQLEELRRKLQVLSLLALLVHKYKY
jgi:chromosome segregation ATPase